MRILLVEDDRRLAENVAAQLREAGFSVDAVAGGKGALYESAIFPYDVIVLDLQLPDLDGVEVCRALRARGTPGERRAVAQPPGRNSRVAAESPRAIATRPRPREPNA